MHGQHEHETSNREESARPDRYLVGLGVSHGPLVKDHSRPYAAMTGYLDELDEVGVAAGSSVLAALGSKMLRQSGERAAGASPYLVTPEPSVRAREILGESPQLAPELKVVLETGPMRCWSMWGDTGPSRPAQAGDAPTAVRPIRTARPPTSAVSALRGLQVSSHPQQAMAAQEWTGKVREPA